MGRHPQVNGRVAMLLKRQQGKCASCHLFFKDRDLLEIDHRVPRAQGGKDEHYLCFFFRGKEKPVYS
jgi:RNA-directed DNA polymerase